MLAAWRADDRVILGDISKDPLAEPVIECDVEKSRVDEISSRVDHAVWSWKAPVDLI